MSLSDGEEPTASPPVEAAEHGVGDDEHAEQDGQGHGAEKLQRRGEPLGSASGRGWARTWTDDTHVNTKL